MTVSNLKIGRQKFIVVPERDFTRLARESEAYRRMVAEDHALGRIAERELKLYRKNGKAVAWSSRNWGCSVLNIENRKDVYRRL